MDLIFEFFLDSLFPNISNETWKTQLCPIDNSRLICAARVFTLYRFLFQGESGECCISTLWLQKRNSSMEKNQFTKKKKKQQNSEPHEKLEQFYS